MSEIDSSQDHQQKGIDPKAFLQIIRPQNCILGSLTVIAGVAMSYKLDPSSAALSTHLTLFIFAYLTYFFVAAGGNVVNDIFDIEVDKINRPHRALPSGRMTVRQAWMYVAFLSLIGVLFAWLNGPLGTVIVVVFLLVGYAYAAKVKELGIAGNLVAAIYIPIPSILFFITAFMILQARETIKGAEDVEGDKLRDVRTIARVYGYNAAAGVAAILNFIGVTCYALIWFLGYASWDLWLLLLLGSTVVIGAAITPLTGPSNAKRLLIGSTLDKIGALVGLITFVVVPLYGIL
jgi:geranylgeranylglycerol-phosphate geranylgeranyltransferase